MSKTFKIISWNVNGIRAAHRKGIVDWVKKTQPDILCLQETKAHLEQLPQELVNIEGYTSSFAEAERKGYSGVATYSKISPQKIQEGFGVKRFDNEGRTMVTEFDNFVLCNVYFPNGKASKERLQYKLDFYNDFLVFIDKIKASGKEVIVCGDVNTAHTEIDLARPKANEKTSGFLPEERGWIDKLISHGYFDTLRLFHPEPNLYSWWDMKTRARDRNVGWRIDYFFASNGLKKQIKDAFIMSDVMGSDHCPVGIELNIA